jgi:hypothetical protein
MPKKTQTAKRKATKTPAKKGRPPAKKTTSKKTAAKNVKKPASKKSNLPVREMNDETGFVAGTDQDVIATALMNGGESRAHIAEIVADQIDSETRNGTEKQIPNMVSGVLQKMLDRGYTVESSFAVLPPTPASKRAATRAANKKAAPAKKTAAKKTTAKKTASKGKAARSRKR